MADGFEELTRIIWKPGQDGKHEKHVFINRTEMTAEELRRSMMNRDALIRGILQGGEARLNGLEQLFGDISPELKEAIDRARRVDRRR
jgi:hypothetical protein